MKQIIIAAFIAAISFSTSSFAKNSSRPHYGGGSHTVSHGGHYAGGSGKSHKGGSYKNSKTGNRYGTHK